MTAIDWMSTQTKLFAGVDGVPGRETYGKLFAYAAERPFVDPVFQRLGEGAAKHFPRYGALSRERVICVIAQTCHETSGFRRFEENLSYSAKRLAEIWPGRYAIDPKAKIKQPNRRANDVARRPEALANDTYGARLGNLPKALDTDVHEDGWQYRGRGPTMLTGRANYEEVGKALQLPLLANPDLAADPYVGVEITLWFYRMKGVFSQADKRDYEAERRAVNGGLIGLDDVAKIRARLERVVVPD